MKTQKLFATSKLLSILFIMIVSISFSGCFRLIFNYSSLSEFKFDTTIAKDVKIPGEPNVDIRIDKSVSIAKACGKFNIEEIRKEVEPALRDIPIGSNIALNLLKKIKVKNLWIEQIKMKAKEGDFSKIEQISLILKINDKEITFGEGEISSDKTEITFLIDKELDIYPLIKDATDGGCIEGTLHVIGYSTQSDIKFDVNASIKIKLKL
ncbi:MAG: hypothetical protein LDL53_00420 [Candidatus Hydrogenedens sp.]|nr:hypothetical protein [Candidatus Hydrogenedens sp.]